MSTEPSDSEEHRTSEELPQQKESLEDLAGELLGVNLNSSSDSAEEVSLDDLDWGELEFAPSETCAADPEEEISPTVAKSEKQEATHDENDKQDTGVENIDEAANVSDKDDDPLAAWDNSAEDWNWEENQQKSSDRDDEKTVEQNAQKDEPDAAVPANSGSVGLSTRDEDPETAEDFISEYDDNPFGLGLFEEQADNADRPRKRTRRKKQLSSKEEKHETIAEDEIVETEDEFEEIAIPTEDDDDFGADLDLDDEKPRTRRTRRTTTVKKTSARDRSRSQDRKPKEVQRDAKKKTSSSLDEKTSPQQSSQDRKENKPEIASVAKADYRDIPSWEEAISYLLKPSLVGVEKDDSSPGKKSAAKKQTRKTTGRAKTAPHNRKRRR